MGEVSPLTLAVTFLLLRGELESESHPLCHPTSCPHSRHTGRPSSVTMPQPRPPEPLLPAWAQDSLQQPSKEMAEHTHSLGSSTHTRLEQRHHPSHL